MTHTAQSSEWLLSEDLGAFSWLNTPGLRRWLGRWLVAHWQIIYAHSLRTKRVQQRGAFGAAFRGMARSMRGLAPRLTTLPLADQLAAMQRAARRRGLTTTQDCLLYELSYFLKRHAENCKRPQCADCAAHRASPWSNSIARTAHFYFKRGGYDLPAKFYPDNADLRAWFELVIPHFTAIGIEPSPLGPPQACLLKNISQFILSDRQHAPQSLARFVAHATGQQQRSGREMVREYLETGRERGRSVKPVPAHQHECFKMVLRAIARRTRLRQCLRRLAKSDKKRLRLALGALFIRVGHLAAPSIEDILENIYVNAQPVLRDIRRNPPKDQLASAVELEAVARSLTKFRSARSLPPPQPGDVEKGGSLQVLYRRVRRKVRTGYNLV
jgi:hypothetical protein